MYNEDKWLEPEDDYIYELSEDEAELVRRRYDEAYENFIHDILNELGLNYEYRDTIEGELF